MPTTNVNLSETLFEEDVLGFPPPSEYSSVRAYLQAATTPVLEMPKDGFEQAKKELQPQSVSDGTSKFNPCNNKRPSIISAYIGLANKWLYGGRFAIGIVGSLEGAASEIEGYVEPGERSEDHAQKRTQNHPRLVRVGVVAEAVASAKVDFGDCVRNEENVRCVRKHIVKTLRENSMRDIDICSHIDLAVEAVFVPSLARLRASAITASDEIRTRDDILREGLVSYRGLLLHGRHSLPTFLSRK